LLPFLVGFFFARHFVDIDGTLIFFAFFPLGLLRMVAPDENPHRG
jgi:hypothetical protein